MPRELVSWERPISDLRAWDRSPEVKKEYVVLSESEPDIAYLVRKIDALDVPFEDADVVADNRSLLCCSCDDFKYRRWPNDEPDSLDIVGSCKHCQKLENQNL